MPFSLFDVGACNCASGPGLLTCSPCSIPEANLTLSWVNGISGNGSVSMIYSAGPPITWLSACASGQLYKMLCSAGQIELRAIYFTVGICPTGTQAFCSNLGVSNMTLVSSTCYPSFSLTFNTLAGCPLRSSGYTSFTASYP
jgi:hypothetical protein